MHSERESQAIEHEVRGRLWMARGGEVEQLSEELARLDRRRVARGGTSTGWRDVRAASGGIGMSAGVIWTIGKHEAEHRRSPMSYHKRRAPTWVDGRHSGAVAHRGHRAWARGA